VQRLAKVNLCLFLARHGTDGRHELVTLLEPVSLADDLVIAPAAPQRTRWCAPA